MSIPAVSAARVRVRAAAEAWLSSPRVRALVLLWRSSPALSMVAVLFVLAEGALPVLVLIAMGRVTGAIPGAVMFGLSSSQGDALLLTLGEAGAIYGWR